MEFDPPFISFDYISEQRILADHNGMDGQEAPFLSDRRNIRSRALDCLRKKESNLSLKS